LTDIEKKVMIGKTPHRGVKVTEKSGKRQEQLMDSSKEGGGPCTVERIDAVRGESGTPGRNHWLSWIAGKA